MTTTRTTKVRKLWSRPHTWLNKAVVTKVKHLVIAVALIVMVVVASQYQTTRLQADQRRGDLSSAAHNDYIAALHTYDNDLSQWNSCRVRVETRPAVRAIFFDIADGVKDLRLDPAAEAAYIANRKAFVEANYPALPMPVEVYCGVKPTPPVEA